MTNENTSLVTTAIKEINEKDQEGAVSKIKVLMKLVMTNDAEVEKLQKNSSKLKADIVKLAGSGVLTTETFAVPQ